MTIETSHCFVNSSRDAEIARDLPPLSGIVRDPADDVILACAVAGNAEAVVTRDKDLLSLGSYESTLIMTPEEFRQGLRRRTP